MPGLTSRSPSSTPEVWIGHLALDAPLSARSAALASLDRADWPDSGRDNGAWLILRKLEVQTEGWNLGRRVSTKAGDLAGRAVDGWSPGALGADAIRFDSLADLLACLSRDLAQGRAESLWYWRHWLMERPISSVPVLWSDHVMLLPALIGPLRKRDVLKPTLASFKPSDVTALLKQIGGATGWPLPAPVGPDDLADDPVAADHTSPADTDAILDRRSIEALPSAPPTAAAIAGLLIIIRLWERHPTLLMDAVATARCVRQSVRAALFERGMVTTAATTAPRSDSPDEPTSGKVIAPPLIAATAGSPPPAEIPPEITVTRTPATPKPPDEASTVDRQRPGISPAAGGEAAPPPPVAARAAAPVEEPAPSPVEGFITGQGGLFYLINALQHLDIDDAIAASGTSGWAWLWHLGRDLGLEAEPALLSFLAARLGLDHGDELLALDPPTDFAPISDGLARLYRPFKIWNAGLLETPALVALTASHLDIHMLPDRARVDVRLAGLDQNPGWVPWLGRVAAFHFRPLPELMGWLNDE